MLTVQRCSSGLLVARFVCTVSAAPSHSHLQLIIVRPLSQIILSGGCFHLRTHFCRPVCRV